MEIYDQVPESLEGCSEELIENVYRLLTLQKSREPDNWTNLPLLDHPVIRLVAFFEEEDNSSEFSPRSEVLFSYTFDNSKLLSELLDSPCDGEFSESLGTNEEPGTTMSGMSSSLQEAEFDVRASTIRDTPVSEFSEGRAPESMNFIAPTMLSVTSNDQNASQLESSADGKLPRLRQCRLRPSTSTKGTTTMETQDQRRIQSSDRFTKRQKIQSLGHSLKPSSLHKLLTGIWEQIYGDIDLDVPKLLSHVHWKTKPDISSSQMLSFGASESDTSSTEITKTTNAVFNQRNEFCRRVTQASKACRSLEIIVQARWVEYFDDFVEEQVVLQPRVSRSKHHKRALLEACYDFGWSEKDLRNKVHVWRGYKELKEAGGWAALVFAGAGLYRFSKYRVGFDSEGFGHLRNLRAAIEVAADTLHPHWRSLLSAIGESTQATYGSHPHDWVIFLDGSGPVPLRSTYVHREPNFSYIQIKESILDSSVWGDYDPRLVALAKVTNHGLPLCDICGEEQSDNPEHNNCRCFPGMFGGVKAVNSPLLVFHTPDGRNNGLLALCDLDRGSAIAEFVGFITNGLRDQDVMESSTESQTYQIWQGTHGNCTRFVNHSCKANAQYQRFTWLRIQRIVLVSKGIKAGTEITVDYSEKYWKGLDKKCRCGEACCRYSRAVGRA